MRHDTQAAGAQELIVNWILAVEAAISEKITVDLVGLTVGPTVVAASGNAGIGGTPRMPASGGALAVRKAGAEMRSGTRPAVFVPRPVRVSAGSRDIGAGRRRVSRPSLRVQEARTPGDVDAELKDVTAHCGDKGLSNDQRS